MGGSYVITTQALLRGGGEKQGDPGQPGVTTSRRASGKEKDVVTRRVQKRKRTEKGRKNEKFLTVTGVMHLNRLSESKN